jgi:hypothetical protein
MPAPIDPLKVQAVLRDLGVQPIELEALRGCTLEEGQRKLIELKERVRRNYKHLAFELHPDRTDSDPEKTEKFKLLGTIRDEFEKLQLQAMPQPVPVRRPMPNQGCVPMQTFRVQTFRVQSWAAHSIATTASGTTTTVVINPSAFVNMRPNS